MVEITKAEKEKLLEMGCKWHEDIHKTYSGYSTYYLTESKWNMAKLNKIRRKVKNEQKINNRRIHR